MGNSKSLSLPSISSQGAPFINKPVSELDFIRDLTCISGAIHIGGLLFNPFAKYKTTLHKHEMFSLARHNLSILPDFSHSSQENLLCDPNNEDSLYWRHYVLQYLVTHKIQVIVNLIDVTRLEMPFVSNRYAQDIFEAFGIVYISYPISFGETPRTSNTNFSFAEFDRGIMKQLFTYLQQGKNVSFHCHHDIQRSVLMACSLVCKSRRHDGIRTHLQEIYETAKEIQNDIQLNILQREFLAEYLAFLKNEFTAPSPISFQSFWDVCRKDILHGEERFALEDLENFLRIEKQPLLIIKKRILEARSLSDLAIVQDLNPELPHSWSLLGWYHLHTRQYVKAVQWFEASLSQDSVSEIANRGLIQAYWELKEVKKAASACRLYLMLQNGHEPSDSDVSAKLADFERRPMGLKISLEYECLSTVETLNYRDTEEHDDKRGTQLSLKTALDNDFPLNIRGLSSDHVLSPKSHRNHLSVNTVLQERDLSEGSADTMDMFYNGIQGKDKTLAMAACYYGRWLIEHHKYEEALESAEKCLQMDPNNAEGLYLKGVVMYSHKENEQAVKFFDKALGLRPDDPEIYIYQGKALVALEKYDQAEQYFQTALQLDPSRSEARYQKEDIEKKLQDVRREEAMRLGQDIRTMINSNKERASLSTSHDSNERKADYYDVHGQFLCEFEQFEEANWCYDKAIEVNPTNVEYHRAKGEILEKLERFEEALRSYERIIKLSPIDEEAYKSKGRVLGLLGRKKEALASFRKGIEVWWQ